MPKRSGLQPSSSREWRRTASMPSRSISSSIADTRSTTAGSVS
jgi:hypothetical protein